MKMKTLLFLLLQFILLNGSKKNKKEKKLLNLKRLSASENEAVLQGYEEAYELCQFNFKLERWACPKPEAIENAKHPVSFTKIYKNANKEASYVYAIVAAGVAHHMIMACKQGRSKNCQCQQVPKNGLGASVVVCEKYIEQGLKRARRILKNLDYKKVVEPSRRAFNWQNAVTGIQVYKDNMPKTCRCHGVSGHCTTYPCWRTTPPSLKEASIKLKALYNNAVKLRPEDLKEPSSSARNRPTRTLVNDTKLVYINDSPDYCKANAKLGIAGTLYRECDLKKDNSCNKLCTSCGYRKHSFMRKINNSKCECRFIWCCKVECKKCVEKKIFTTCLPPS